MVSLRAAQCCLMLLAVVAFVVGVVFANPAHPLAQFVGVGLAVAFIAAGVLVGDVGDFADKSQDLRHARAVQRDACAPTVHS